MIDILVISFVKVQTVRPQTRLVGGEKNAQKGMLFGAPRRKASLFVRQIKKCPP
jgi:hypothetical protein